MDWETLLSTFGLVFVAELGDKTQLAVITQTCRYRQPRTVFLGASLALTAATALGAAGGHLLGQIVPVTALRDIAALAFVTMGLLVGREALRAGTTKDTQAVQKATCDGQDTEASSIRGWRTFGATFGLLFVAELGDKTQLAILGLAGKDAAPCSVFAGGALALTLVTALGVAGGEKLCRIIPERLLLWLSAAAFVAMGILMGFGMM